MEILHCLDRPEFLLYPMYLFPLPRNSRKNLGLYLPVLLHLLHPSTNHPQQEDIDAYYRDSPPLLVFRDKDATSSKRPAKYATHEEEQVRRASSAADREAYRRGSRISARNEEHAASATNKEVWDHSGKDTVGKEEV